MTDQSQNILDQTTLDQFQELQMPGEPDILIEIIESYLSTTPQRMESISKAINSKNFVAATKEAHALKSSSQVLGALKLAEVCSKIEMDKEGTHGQELLEKLKHHFKDAIQALSELHHKIKVE